MTDSLNTLEPSRRPDASIPGPVEAAPEIDGGELIARMAAVEFARRKQKLGVAILDANDDDDVEQAVKEFLSSSIKHTHKRYCLITHRRSTAVRHVEQIRRFWQFDSMGDHWSWACSSAEERKSTLAYAIKGAQEIGDAFIDVRIADDRFGELTCSDSLNQRLRAEIVALHRGLSQELDRRHSEDFKKAVDAGDLNRMKSSLARMNDYSSCSQRTWDAIKAHLVRLVPDGKRAAPGPAAVAAHLSRELGTFGDKKSDGHRTVKERFEDAVKATS